MVTALSRRDEGLTHEEVLAFLERRLGEHLLGSSSEYATFTLRLDAEGYLEAARLLKEEERLSCSMFDCLFGVDAGEEGLDVVAVLYSVETGLRVLLRHRCEGGRDQPLAPSISGLFRGAGWHEREAWDMFGIEFDGHPGLAPRLLCAENFEGWPLRKDFHLASREAKPWPGVKEPAELDEDGNVIERVPGPGDAPGPTALDEAMAEQARLANPADEIADPDAAPAEASDERVPEGDEAPSADDGREAASAARARADEQRRNAAEARAEKAAEQAGAPAPTPPGDVDEVPEGRQRDADGTGTGDADDDEDGEQV